MATDRIALSSLERVLILRLSSIGDVIHALPVASALKGAFPHLHLTWVVEEMSSEIVRLNAQVDRVIVLPRSRWKQGRTSNPQVWKEYIQFLVSLRRERFDLSLDLQGYAKSGLMALASGAPHRRGWRRMRDGSGSISPPVPTRAESLHRVEWFLDVVRSLGIEIPQGAAEFGLAPSLEARNSAAALLQEAGGLPGSPPVVVNPAAGNLVRRWGAENYAQVIARLSNEYGLQSVLIGTERDAELNRETIRLSKSRLALKAPIPLDLAGKTSLNEVAALLEGCRFHLCGDTGSAHLAAALKKPVVAVYGPTDPTAAGPYGQAETVLYRSGICGAACTAKACSRVAQHPTSVELPPCLAQIQPDEVFEKIRTIL